MLCDNRYLNRLAEVLAQDTFVLLCDLPTGSRFVLVGGAGQGVWTVVFNPSDVRRDILAAHATGLRREFEPWTQVYRVDTTQE